MTAAETIQAAIDKLEALRAKSTPGAWSHPQTILGQPCTTIFAGESREHAAYLSGVAHTLDGDLIVTLHRTIDAQLAILRTAQGMLRPGVGVTVVNDALVLARAILGEVS